ncbi:MAG: hypothetical protein M5U26_23945 [Planctomycetota bacterium]|nr:hypothetical protein [Planctomycetota bacterium]
MERNREEPLARPGVGRAEESVPPPETEMDGEGLAFFGSWIFFFLICAAGIVIFFVRLRNMGLLRSGLPKPRSNPPPRGPIRPVPSQPPVPPPPPGAGEPPAGAGEPPAGMGTMDDAS